MKKDEVDALAAQIEKDLYEHIGPLLFGDKLYAALGLRSYEAFRQAYSRKALPVEIFSLSKRRGKFALSRDVARWLAENKLKQQEKGGRI